MPHVFREKYPETVAIIDCSEVFMETPSDFSQHHGATTIIHVTFSLPAL